MVTKTPKMTDNGKAFLNSRPLLLPPHQILSTPTSFLSMPSQDQEANMIELKHSSTTRVMAMSTPNTTDNGRVLLNKRQLHSPLLKTHFTPTSFHLMPCLDQEESMIELKLSNIMRVMVMLTLSMMDNGKVSPRQLHSPLHKTHCMLTNYHSMPSLDQEVNTIEPKLSNITKEMVTKTPNTMDNGKDFLNSRPLHS